MKNSEFFTSSLALVSARLFALTLNLLIIPTFVLAVGENVFVEWEKIVALSRFVTITNSAYTATVLWKLVNSNNLLEDIAKYSYFSKYVAVASFILYSLIFLIINQNINFAIGNSLVLIFFLTFCVSINVYSDTLFVGIETSISPAKSALFRTIAMLFSLLTAYLLLKAGFIYYAFLAQYLVMSLLMIVLGRRTLGRHMKTGSTSNADWDRDFIKFFLMTCAASLIVVSRSSLIQLFVSANFTSGVYAYFLSQRIVNIVVMVSSAITVPLSIFLFKLSKVKENNLTLIFGLLVLVSSRAFFMVSRNFYEYFFVENFDIIEEIFGLHIIGIFGVIASTLIPNTIHNINGRKVYELRYVLINSLFILSLLITAKITHLNLINFTFIFYFTWIISGLSFFWRIKNVHVPLAISILSCVNLFLAWY